MKNIIFEDENILVVHKTGGSAYLLITFGDRVTLAAGDRFSAEKPVTAGNINCIGFMAKSANWYPKKSIMCALAVVEEITARFDMVITYGGSMGGYAALKYSALLKATSIISYIPQWSIAPQDVGANDRRYTSYYTDEMCDMAIDSADISGAAYIFVDPHHKQDFFHYEQIVGAYPAAKKVNVYSSNHDVTAILAGSSALKSIVESAAYGTGEKLIHAVAEIRRKSRYRVKIVLERAVARHPLLLLAMYERAKWATSLLEDPFFKPVRMKFLQAASQLELSDVDFYRLSSTLALENIEELKSVIFTSKQVELVKTFHSTVLVYDLLNGDIRCVCDDELAKFHHYHPIALSRDYGVLDVRLAGRFYSLSFKGGVIINRSPAEQDTSALITYRKINGYYVISSGGLNMTSLPGGRVVFDVSHIKNWEKFYLGPATPGNPE